jgi:RHS repeat-associated protein
MNRYFVVAVALIAFSFASPAVGQTCYTPITSWQATYNMTAVGSGEDKFGVYNWTISHQMQGNPNLPLSGASCSGMGFGGIDANPTATGTANDHGVAPNCGDGSANKFDISGGPAFDEASSLGINLAAGNYTFWDVLNISSTTVVTTCGSGDSQIIPFALMPINTSCTGPITTPVFPLPPTIQTLSQTGATVSGATAYCAPATWTLGFTLTPVYTDDDDCKKDGGSTVGCLNQSLGEDLGLVGTGMHLHYEGSRLTAGGGDGIANADALMIGGWTLNIHHVFNPGSQTLYLGGGGQRNGYQLGVPVPYMGNILLTSGSGDQVYVFSPTGQHLQTVRPFTGALLYQFGYDSANRLVTVTDASGSVTTIKRNGAGQATSIVSAYAQSTVLTMDSNGFLAQIKDPLGKLQSFSNTAGGQIIERTDANGNIYSYTYDDGGHLIKDADPVGGYRALTRTNATAGLGWSVAHATAMGVTSNYQNAVTLPWSENPANPSFAQQQTNIWPTGLKATGSKSIHNGQLVRSVVLPQGESSSETTGPDPIWGLQTPVITTETDTKGALTMNTTGSRVATLATPGNPFSVATETNTQIVNGRTYTTAFTGANLTLVNTTPVNRAVSIVFDSQERVASTQATGLTATALAYTAKGKLASITRGARQTAFTYNPKGFLSAASDPLKHVTKLTYDADGRLLSTTLPDTRVVSRTYDGNGNLLSLTPPGKSAHKFTYTGVDQVASYTPPGGAAETFAYDLDRRITSMVRPGSQTITYDYDTAGRLAEVVLPTGTETFTYNSTTGNIASAIRGSEHVAYAYNGSLLTKSTWSGTVAGNVARVFNNNFWITSQSVNGSSPIPLHYDNDGLLTAAGALTVRRNAANGFITGTTLGVVSDTRTYNAFGELTGYTATVSGAAAYKYQLTLNADSMITAKSETVGGATNTYAYTYDLAGRLTGAARNGVTDTYSYDTNSNRVTGVTSSGTANGTYDTQDRQLTYGATTFAYNPAGDTTSQTSGGMRTAYTYDALGNLTAATLPNATKLTYVIDAENHRVGKTVNGVRASGFLYDDDDRIVAQLNGSNQLVSQFVYATGLGSPDYMIAGTSTYRIIHDAVGSPVMLIDTASGTVAEQITYDEFGNVLSDTNPGFQPFGFAGGLYDQDTRLIRFGARDYNPATGRWTVKDQTLLSGGDTNLYDYAQTDPINHTDSNGLGCPSDDKKKKAKKILKDVAKKVAGDKVKVGPINISTDKPEISVGDSVKVTVDGQTVAEADGSVAVGITPGEAKPGEPLIYVDTDVAIKINLPGGKSITIWENKTHTETLTPEDVSWVVPVIEEHNAKLEKSMCETCSDGVQQ